MSKTLSREKAYIVMPKIKDVQNFGDIEGNIEAEHSGFSDDFNHPEGEYDREEGGVQLPNRSKRPKDGNAEEEKQYSESLKEKYYKYGIDRKQYSHSSTPKQGGSTPGNMSEISSPKSGSEEEKKSGTKKRKGKKTTYKTLEDRLASQKEISSQEEKQRVMGDEKHKRKSITGESISKIKRDSEGQIHGDSSSEGSDKAQNIKSSGIKHKQKSAYDEGQMHTVGNEGDIRQHAEESQHKFSQEGFDSREGYEGYEAHEAQSDDMQQIEDRKYDPDNFDSRRGDVDYKFEHDEDKLDVSYDQPSQTPNADKHYHEIKIDKEGRPIVSKTEEEKIVDTQGIKEQKKEIKQSEESKRLSGQIKGVKDEEVDEEKHKSNQPVYDLKTQKQEHFEDSESQRQLKIRSSKKGEYDEKEERILKKEGDVVEGKEGQISNPNGSGLLKKFEKYGKEEYEEGKEAIHERISPQQPEDAMQTHKIELGKSSLGKIEQFEDEGKMKIHKERSDKEDIYSEHKESKLQSHKDSKKASQNEQFEQEGKEFESSEGHYDEEATHKYIGLEISKQKKDFGKGRKDQSDEGEGMKEQDEDIFEEKYGPKYAQSMSSTLKKDQRKLESDEFEYEKDGKDKFSESIKSEKESKKSTGSIPAKFSSKLTPKNSERLELESKNKQDPKLESPQNNEEVQSPSKDVDKDENLLEEEMKERTKPHKEIGVKTDYFSRESLEAEGESSEHSELGQIKEQPKKHKKNSQSISESSKGKHLETPESQKRSIRSKGKKTLKKGIEEHKSPKYSKYLAKSLNKKEQQDEELEKGIPDSPEHQLMKKKGKAKEEAKFGSSKKQKSNYTDLEKLKKGLIRATQQHSAGEQEYERSEDESKHLSEKPGVEEDKEIHESIKERYKKEIIVKEGDSSSIPSTGKSPKEKKKFTKTSKYSNLPASSKHGESIKSQKKIKPPISLKKKSLESYKHEPSPSSSKNTKSPSRSL
jgi:hypothetical protein